MFAVVDAALIVKPLAFTHEVEVDVDLTGKTDEEIRQCILRGQAYLVRDAQGQVTRVIEGEAEWDDAAFVALLNTPKPATTAAMQELEAKAAMASAPARLRKTSFWETRWIEQLLCKYGHDYKAMARDMALNRMQNTPAQLRRKCELYLAQKNVS